MTATQPALHPKTVETAAPQLEVLPAPLAASRPAPGIQNRVSSIEHPAATRAFKPKVRNGKIARLPHIERDMVNRMLRNSIPYDKIREALEEHGIRVTERNISNWKTRGGYKEWCAEQDRASKTVSSRIISSSTSENTMLPIFPKSAFSLLPLTFHNSFSSPKPRPSLPLTPKNSRRPCP